MTQIIPGVSSPEAIADAQSKRQSGGGATTTTRPSRAAAGSSIPLGDTNARVARLMRGGYQWMPLQTLYALADSGLTDKEITDTAEGMRQAALGKTASTVTKPFVEKAAKAVDYQQQATDYARGTQLNTKDDLAPDGTTKPVTLNQQDAKSTVDEARVQGVAKDVKKGDDGFKVFFDDPVLQKHPSAALALKQYLSGAIGAYPVKDEDLGHIQTQLQVQGFGRELKPDGTWNQGWDAAQQQWKDAVYRRQLGGERAGGLSVGHAVEALHALTPTAAGDALIGFAKALPDGARQLMADLVGGASGAAYMLTQEPRVPFFSKASKGENEHFGRAASDTINALGGDTTAKEQQSGIEHHAGLRLLEDASNIIMLSSIMGSAGRFAEALGTESAAYGTEYGAKLSADAAFRGPGVIAGSLGKPVVRAAIGGVVGAGAASAAGASGGGIVAAGLGGAALGAATTTGVWGNLPVLGRTGPVIDSLADADGLYYRARRLVAAPYKLAATRLADTAFQQSILVGAEARGLAQVQDWVGGNGSTEFSRQVEGTHTLDSVNDSIKHRLDFTLLGQHIAPSLDDTMFLLTGRGATALGESSSAHIGLAVDKAKEGMESAMSGLGVDAAIERATGLSRRQAISDLGGEENYVKFWANKLKMHAVSWMAERQRTEELAARGFPDEIPGLPSEPGFGMPGDVVGGKAEGAVDELSSLDRMTDLRNKENAIYSDPEQVKQAIRGLLGQGTDSRYSEELVNRIRREITNTRMDARSYLQRDGKDYLAAVKAAERDLKPHAGAFVEGDVLMPASATGAESGEGLPELFHGASRRFNTGEGPTIGAGSGAHNLLGPGFYATDDIDVAGTYMRKGIGDDPSVHRVQWGGESAPKVLDAEGRATPEIRDTLREWWAQQVHEVDPTEEAAAAVDGALEGGDSVASIIKHVRNAIGSSGQVPTNTAHEIMDGLAYNLESLGYDALRYDGGVRTGNESHNAYVFLDPDKVSVERLGPNLSPRRQSSENKILLNASDAPGGLGLARKGTLSRQVAWHKVQEMRDELEELTGQVAANGDARGVMGRDAGVPHPGAAEELDQFEVRLGDFLFENFGVDARRMPHRGVEKLDAAEEFAKHLAVDVHVHPDAPQEVKDAVAKIAALGYKPVSGTDIGWIMHESEAADRLTGPLTWRRRMAGHLGIDPTVIEDKAIAARRRDGIRNAIADGVEKGTIRLPPWHTPDSILAYLQADGIIGDTAGPIKESLQTLFRVPQRLAKREQWVNEAGNVDIERAQEEINQALQLRDLPRKKVIDALTDPVRWENQHGGSAIAHNLTDSRSFEEQAASADKHWLGSPDLPPMSKDSAEAVYAAIVKGSATPPGYMLGASRIDDLFRASMGFAGKGIAPRAVAGGVAGGLAGLALDPEHPDKALYGAVVGSALAAAGGDRLGWAMANLPNKLVQLRNELRFDLSPYFSLRRVAKVNVKMAAEGVVPTINPFKAMEGAGTLWHDRDVLERVRPQLFVKADQDAADDALRYLEAQDVFGLYNGRDFEAYAAGHWARQGLDDEAINEKLVKTFEYGTKGVAGRSALERSTNFLFFPWSFDKTLYRNLGAYILDKPAQRLLLTRGMAAYDEFNRTHMDGSNPLATSFYEKHLPILTEVENLNAFAHGISAGEPGGINRPLLNLFMPQNWQASDANLATLKRFVPVVKDFQRVYEKSLDQASIMQATGENMWRDLHGIPATYGNPVKSSLTKQAQLEAAFDMQRKWYENYAEVVDFNGSHRDKAEKIRFPMSAEWGKWAGEPITKSVIREIVALAYPQYSPEGAVVAATSSSREWQQYVLDNKGGELHDYISDFADNTLRLGRGMNNNRFSAADVRTYTSGLRQQAVYLAQRDPDFYRLYEKNFRRILGPLEGVTHNG